MEEITRKVMIFIGGLVLALMLMASASALFKSQSEQFVLSSGFGISEDIANSIDILGASNYNGSVAYVLPNVDCKITFSERRIMTESNLSVTSDDEAETSYVRTTNYNFTYPADGIICGQNNIVVIEKKGEMIEVIGDVNG